LGYYVLGEKTALFFGSKSKSFDLEKKKKKSKKGENIEIGV
jgi:hypothetical protein